MTDAPARGLEKEWLCPLPGQELPVPDPPHA